MKKDKQKSATTFATDKEDKKKVKPTDISISSYLSDPNVLSLLTRFSSHPTRCMGY